LLWQIKTAKVFMIFGSRGPRIHNSITFEWNYKIPSNTAKIVLQVVLLVLFNYKGDMFRHTAIFRPTYIKHQ
jgi:hypothetical protein